MFEWSEEGCYMSAHHPLHSQAETEHELRRSFKSSELITYDIVLMAMNRWRNTD